MLSSSVQEQKRKNRRLKENIRNSNKQVEFFAQLASEVMGIVSVRSPNEEI